MDYPFLELLLKVMILACLVAMCVASMGIIYTVLSPLEPCMSKRPVADADGIRKHKQAVRRDAMLAARRGDVIHGEILPPDAKIATRERYRF